MTKELPVVTVQQDPIITLSVMKFNGSNPQDSLEVANKNGIDINQNNSDIRAQFQLKTTKLEEKLKNPNLSESEQAQLRQQLALVSIQMGYLSESQTYYDSIGQKSIQHDLLFQVQTQIMRFAIYWDNKDLYEKHLKTIQDMKNLSFDNQSQLQLYQALDILLFKPVSTKSMAEICMLLTQNISTFTAENIICFRDYVVISFIVAICRLDRKNLQLLIDKQMDNYNTVVENETAKKLLNVIACDYSSFTNAIQQLTSDLQHSFILRRYSDVLVDLFKAKIYDQYLKTFNLIQLQKVAADFKIQLQELVVELEYFIFQGFLEAKMTETALIRVQKDECSELFQKFYAKASNLVGKLEVAQRK